jgi:hypothetical protein
MRLMERRGWTLLALPIMVLVFLLAQIDTTTHLSPSKPTEIQRTKATWKEKNENRKLAKQYAWVAFGWRGGEWECLESLWTMRAGLTTSQATNKEAQLSVLLSSLEREVESLHSKYCEAYVTLTLVMERLAKLTSSLLPTDTTKE